MDNQLVLNKELLRPDFDKLNPVLEFGDGQCRLRMQTEGGTVQERLISAASIREAATHIPIDSGWMPSEVVRWGNRRGMDWCVAIIPASKRRLELTQGTPGVDETIEHIVAPLPGFTLFGAGTTYFIWALDGEFSPKQQIYRCPLPNVYVINQRFDKELHMAGEICWGPLKPPVCSPRTILRAWDLFINSTFNNHGPHGKCKSQEEDVRVLLRELAVSEAENFPLDELIPQVDEHSFTVDGTIRSFFEDGKMVGSLFEVKEGKIIEIDDWKI